MNNLLKKLIETISKFVIKPAFNQWVVSESPMGASTNSAGSNVETN